MFNWCTDEAIPSLFDLTALLRSQILRTDNDGQLVEATGSSIYGLCYWHMVSFNGLELHRLLTI